MSRAGQVAGRRVTSVALSTPSRLCRVVMDPAQASCVWDACTLLCSYSLDVLAIASTCRGRLGIAPLAGRSDSRRGFTLVSAATGSPDPVC